jgi:hypothetical protein
MRKSAVAKRIDATSTRKEFRFLAHCECGTKLRVVQRKDDPTYIRVSIQKPGGIAVQYGLPECPQKYRAILNSIDDLSTNR